MKLGLRLLRYSVMARPGSIYPAKRYTGKDVQMLISDSFISFLRLTKQHQFTKEVFKGMQKSDVVLMNEVKRQIHSMNAVWSGFLRSSLHAWIDASDKNIGFASGQIVSYVATSAWYDILVHEGLGIHSNGGSSSIPHKYLPSAAQKAIAPEWEDVKHIKKNNITKGPRPFMSNALVNSSRKIFMELGDGVRRGIRNTMAASSHLPRRDLDRVLSSIQLGA